MCACVCICLMCNNTCVCVRARMWAFQRAFWWIEKNCTWNRKKSMRPQDWKVDNGKPFGSPLILSLSSYCNIWVKCCHSKLQFLLLTSCFSRSLSPFNLLLCSHSHGRIPFSLLSTYHRPLCINVRGCVRGYMCMCAAQFSTTTRRRVQCDSLWILPTLNLSW